MLDDCEMALQLLNQLDSRLDEDLAAISQAVEHRDAEETRKLAHKLKGTAANLSADPLRWTCSRLEAAAVLKQADSFPECLGDVARAAQQFRAAVESLVEKPTPPPDTSNPRTSPLVEESRT